MLRNPSFQLLMLILEIPLLQRGRTPERLQKQKIRLHLMRLLDYSPEVDWILRVH